MPRPWRVAASYLATRRLFGGTALEWADEDNGEAVTRIVNGSLNGLEDRRSRTARALNGLRGVRVLPLLRRGAEGPEVELLQRALAARGFSPGALDGTFGSNTTRAVEAFQRAVGLEPDGVVGDDTWKQLRPLPE